MITFKKSVMATLIFLVTCIAVVFGLSPINETKSARAYDEVALPMNVVGGSIRLPMDEEDVVGIRFLCEVQWEEYFGEDFSAFDSMGVLLGLKSDGDLTVENHRAKVEYLTDGVLSDTNKLNRGYVENGQFVLDDTSNCYSMFVYCYDIPVEEYHTEFSCVGYLQVEGNVFYTESVSRSVAQVAYKAYQDTDNADEKAVLKEILTAEGYSHDTNAWGYDDENHYACCSLCGYYDETEGEAHDISDATGLCSVCGKGFEAAVLLDGVESFTYTVEATYNHEITLENGETVTYTTTQNGASYATKTKGKDVSTSVRDKDVINVIFTNDPWNPSPETGSTSLTDKIEWYYLIENGVEYQLSYHKENGVWEQSRLESDMSFEAMKETGLSIFRNATKKFDQFTYDEESGTYKNSVPMSLEVKDISSEGWVSTDRLDKMYFEFKIVNGKIEWMDLTADATCVIDYTTGDKPLWTYVNGSLVGQKQSEKLTGPIHVRYFNINATTLELPEEIVLDETVTSYPCQHEHVGEWEQQAYFHMRKCSDCNRWINYAAHDFENGTCVDCGYACLHDSVTTGNTPWEDNGFNHQIQCHECSAIIVAEHDFGEGDGEGKCIVCGAQNCAHANKSQLVQIGSEYHGWQCMDCGSMLREAHSFENEICTVCNYEVCHHEGEQFYQISEWQHGFQCNSCGEWVSGEHIYEGEGTICTVCGYDSECEHLNTKLGPVNADSHGEVCSDCGCMVGNMGEMHTYVDGVCKGCNYVCAHTNVGSWQANGDNHERQCNTCNKIFQEAHVFDNGFCVECNAMDCDHENVSELYVQNNSFHAVNCMDCGAALLQPHDYGEDEICTVCYHKLCHHENVSFEIYVDRHNGNCLDCYEWIGEEHVFEGTICTVCRYDSSCQHTWETAAINENSHGSVCTACKLIDLEAGTSGHTFEGGVCVDCRYQCVHSLNWQWDDDKHFGTCHYCNAELSAEHVAPEGEWQNEERLHYQLCVICQKQMNTQEHAYENGVCTVCSYECSHSSWDNSVCMYCKMECTHEWLSWTNGGDEQHYRTCSICNSYEHEDHRSESDEWKICFQCEHAKSCDVCGGVFARTGHETNENGVCTVCSLNATCTHEGTEASYQPAFSEWDRNDWHVKYYDCCGVYIEENHTFENGVCSHCAHSCEHYKTCTPSGTTGVHTALCTHCGHTWAEACENTYYKGFLDYHELRCDNCQGVLLSENHVLGEDGYCTACPYDGNCLHENVSYYSISDTQHEILCNYCSVCKGYEDHTYYMDGSVCEYCSYRCGHDDVGHEVTCEPNEGEDTHTYTCLHCEAVWTVSHQVKVYQTTEYHYYLCSDCGVETGKAEHSFDEYGQCWECWYQQGTSN